MAVCKRWPLPESPQTAVDLGALSARLDDCRACTTVEYGYRHMPGAGCGNRPEFMLVLIHPTPRNPTTVASWDGPRTPMAAAPQFWRVLAAAGLVDPELPGQLAAEGPTQAMVRSLIAEAERRKLYITNAVKCVDGASNVPAARRLELGWSVLREEIALVRPACIVACGLMPFRILTGREIRLSDELWRAQHGSYAAYDSRAVNGDTCPVYPCYFPTGRGNPVASTAMLKLLRRRLQ